VGARTPVGFASRWKEEKEQRLAAVKAGKSISLHAIALVGAVVGEASHASAGGLPVGEDAAAGPTMIRF